MLVRNLLWVLFPSFVRYTSYVSKYCFFTEIDLIKSYAISLVPSEIKISFDSLKSILWFEFTTKVLLEFSLKAKIIIATIKTINTCIFLLQSTVHCKNTVYLKIK